VPLIGLLVDYIRAYQRTRAPCRRRTIAPGARDPVAAAAVGGPQMAGWDIAGRCEFVEAIGGDYFDYLKLPDGRLRIVVADVSGHDPGASLLMANARAYLRAVSSPTSDLATTIQQVNQFLCVDAQGRRFVTMFVCELTPGSPHVTYVGCGHAALWLSTDGRCTPLDATGMPLGVAADYRLEAKVLSDVRTGDVLLLSTDGLTEAAAPTGAMLGREGVAPMLQTGKHRSATELVAALFNEVHRFTERSTFQDDVTVVAALRQ
jgi:sigma-B regulation protein RsbU (phosphoserine phosphatase)